MAPNEPDGSGEKDARTNSDVPRILIVDDERSILTFARRLLSNAGYQVEAALSGPEALAVVDNQSPFALFIIDVVMSGMPGDELAQRLLQRFPSARVLYFGQSDYLFEGQGVLSEREAFIDKPVAIKDLLEAVSMSLFGHTRGPEPLRPAVRCPNCQGSRTIQILWRFYFCLECVKSFERQAPTKAPDA